MPKPPGIIDKANYIVKFIEDPCVAPWTVYVETALEAAGDLVLGYATPSPQDVLRFYVKPRSARSRGKFLRDVEEAGEEEEELGLLPDVNEVIGTLLPFSDRLAESAVHDKISWFWALDGVLERVLWYWFLAEMLEDFLFDWTTALNKTEYCSVDRGGSALVQRDEQFVFFAGIWHAVTPGTVVKSWGGVQGTTNLTIDFVSSPGTVVGGMAVTATFGVTEVEVGLFRNAEAEPVQSKFMNFSFDFSTAQTCMFSQDAQIGDVYSFNVRYNADSTEQRGIFLTNINLNGFGESTQSGVPDQF